MKSYGVQSLINSVFLSKKKQLGKPMHSLQKYLEKYFSLIDKFKVDFRQRFSPVSKVAVLCRSVKNYLLSHLLNRWEIMIRHITQVGITRKDDKKELLKIYLMSKMVRVNMYIPYDL